LTHYTLSMNGKEVYSSLSRRDCEKRLKEVAGSMGLKVLGDMASNGTVTIILEGHGGRGYAKKTVD